MKSNPLAVADTPMGGGRGCVALDGRYLGARIFLGQPFLPPSRNVASLRISGVSAAPEYLVHL